MCGGGGLDSLGAVALREEEPIIVEILNDYRGEGDGSQEYLMNCRENYQVGEHVYNQLEIHDDAMYVHIIVIFKLMVLVYTWYTVHAMLAIRRYIIFILN